jgi:hypothetical protein
MNINHELVEITGFRLYHIKQNISHILDGNFETLDGLTNTLVFIRNDLDNVISDIKLMAKSIDDQKGAKK